MLHKVRVSRVTTQCRGRDHGDRLSYHREGGLPVHNTLTRGRGI